MPPIIRKIESGESPKSVSTTEMEHIPVAGSPEWFKMRAAYRRSPQAHEDARRQIEEGRWIDTILEPSAEDQEYAQRNDGRFPHWGCEINGVPMYFPIGEPIKIPEVFYQSYANSKRMPIFRKAAGEAGVVFSRPIGDGPALSERSEPF